MNKKLYVTLMTLAKAVSMSHEIALGKELENYIENFQYSAFVFRESESLGEARVSIDDGKLVIRDQYFKEKGALVTSRIVKAYALEDSLAAVLFTNSGTSYIIAYKQSKLFCMIIDDLREMEAAR